MLSDLQSDRELSERARRFEAFPNPSSSRVLLQFRLERDGKTALSIYDAKDREGHPR